MTSVSHNAKLVSIIIPTYSRPKNLVRAIKSALTQEMQGINIEVIVVDDNGEGTKNQVATETLLDKYIEEGKIVYIKHEINKNASAARNTGLKVSKGDYICFLDDDDILTPHKIRCQVETLEENFDFDATFCDTEIIRVNGSSKKTRNPSEISSVEKVLSGKCFFNTSTVLFRRTVLYDLHGFDERFKRHQDYELYLRYFRKRKMIKTKDVKVVKYETPNESSRNPDKAEEYLDFFFSVFKEEISHMLSKNDIFFYQYNTCLVRYLTIGKYKDALRLYKKTIKFGKPSFFSYLKYLYHFFKGLSYRF